MYNLCQIQFLDFTCVILDCCHTLLYIYCVDHHRVPISIIWPVQLCTATLQICRNVAICDHLSLDLQLQSLAILLINCNCHSRKEAYRHVLPASFQAHCLSLPCYDLKQCRRGVHLVEKTFPLLKIEFSAVVKRYRHYPGVRVNRNEREPLLPSHAVPCKVDPQAGLR
uniref:Alfin-like protein n=1 Tax=Ulva partita TaxID=1605170 RepID=A0A1C9ZQC6_9CHLO|nr:alfin-like protein [Ulva partita]BAV58241.1 alfin-like protein [Ulva partita]